MANKLSVKEQQVHDALQVQDVFKLKSIDNVNHKPHPYMLGPRHVQHANENHYGGLGVETLKAVQCAQPNCKYTYEEHTSEEVCFLQLMKNSTNEEVGKVLKELVDTLGEAFVDGFAFVETKEKYRVT